MNRLVRPVQFAFEPDVVSIFGLVSFGAAGAPTLNTNYSKGICNITRSAVAFTANVDGSTAVLTNISSFAGLFVGMTVTGTGIPASTTISSMIAGTSVTLSQNTTVSGTARALSAAGGRYTIQFGRQAGVQLDAYVRLLMAKHVWDESAAAAAGSASALALSPAAPAMFIVGNNVSVITIPPTAASALTSCTVTVQFGTLSGATFVAADPASGESVRLAFEMTRSTAI